MRRRNEKTPNEVAEDARQFLAARSVLATGSRPAIDGGAKKMFGFLFTGGCDATVSREGFFVRFTWNPGPHEYLSCLAPTLLSHLLHWASVEPGCSELCAVPLAAHGLNLVRFRQPDNDAQRLFWFRDGGEVIRFAMRVEAPELRATAWPPPIERLPPAADVYRDLNPPKLCPHCAVPLSRVRDLGSFMVCHECGRSFRSWDPSNPNPRSS